MKVLGRGWQYTTYDLGNGRVLKNYNSVLEAYWAMTQDCFPFFNDPFWKLPGFYRGCREVALTSIQKVLHGPLELWMMGNPKILNELDYEQDKLVPLHDVVRTADTTKGKALIDKFVEFNKILVGRGLIDKSFNITKNFGLDSQDRVVLMDLGELYSSKEAIDEQCRKRMWASDYVVKFIENEKVRNYYIAQMDKKFGSGN